MGGGAAMVVPLKFAVVTEKTVCAKNTFEAYIIYNLFYLNSSTCIIFIAFLMIKPVLLCTYSCDLLLCKQGIMLSSFLILKGYPLDCL
jgi:hypothetical protein